MDARSPRFHRWEEGGITLGGNHAGTATDQRYLRVAAVVASAVAGAIHLAAVRSHTAEYAPASTFMLFSGLAQLAWALLAARAVASRRLALRGLAGNASIVALWLVSRTIGLPFAAKPWTAEHMHAPDQLATLMEIIIVLACVAMLRPSFFVRARLLATLSTTGAVASVFSTSHEPSRERLVVVATLTLVAGGIALSRAIVARPLGRGNEAQARVGRFVVAARASAGASS